MKAKYAGRARPTTRHPTTLSVVTALISLLTGPAAQGAEQGSVEHPAAVRQLMQGAVIPASTAVFAAAAEPPTTTTDWIALRRTLQSLSTAAQLLARQHSSDPPLWLQQSRALQHATKQAQQAVKARNGERLSSAGDAIYATCEACHSTFLHKP